MASTLAVALTAAGLGIILRGVAYALRSATSGDAEARAVDTLTAVGSLLAPFALAAAAGGIASQRVPVGNAAGDLWSSWLNPTSLMAGRARAAVERLPRRRLPRRRRAPRGRRGDGRGVPHARARRRRAGGRRGDRGRARRALRRALDLRPPRRHAGGAERRRCRCWPARATLALVARRRLERGADQRGGRRRGGRRRLGAGAEPGAAARA